MEFKQLEIKPEGNRLKRTLTSAHFKRTIIAMGVGAMAGFAFFYFTEGRLMESIPGTEILKSMAVGGFFGLFMTNSPCARGRC
ncbi:MAG: hypothetical protein KAT15_30870 [Bacteroidales bacterium]|nr:hypothetical protein [Bacteroidales bacterium]